MGHIPEDENNDEFMNASAEEWSKPEEAPSSPVTPEEETDRWGSPVPEENEVSNANRWGSEPIASGTTNDGLPVKKKGMQWWVIVIIAVVILCLCVCALTFFAPRLFGINLFQNSPF